MAKTEIDKRARGTSERLIHGYLAKKWFFSVHLGNKMLRVDIQEYVRFLKLIHIEKYYLNLFLLV
jgi:hypothetical protein